MPSRCERGCAARQRPKEATTPRSRSRCPRTPLRPPRSALLEVLVDPLAVRAHGGTWLGRAGHRKHLATQRDDVGAHHGTLGDLVLLDVVEDLGSVIVGAVVDAFVGVGAFDRLGLHEDIVLGYTAV